jgi:hypothetical protein
MYHCLALRLANWLMVAITWSLQQRRPAPLRSGGHRTFLIIMTDYPTCRETAVALRIYHGRESPSSVTERLKLKPTATQKVGGEHAENGRKFRYPASGWFLSSALVVDSRNAAVHLDWLLGQIEPKASELAALRKDGFFLDVACCWDSADGEGGPEIGAPALGRLGALELDLVFDISFTGAYQWLRTVKTAHGVD